jgi:hypothetical protein
MIVIRFHDEKATLTRYGATYHRSILFDGWRPCDTPSPEIRALVRVVRREVKRQQEMVRR